MIANILGPLALPSCPLRFRDRRRPLMSLSERATAARLPQRMLVAHGASLDTRNSFGNSAR
jgi:hypothetical protein